MNRLDWRWLSLLGLVLGLICGLAAFLLAETRLAIPICLLAVAALTRLGWNAQPGLARPLVASPPAKPPRPRLVEDGPFEMVELPGGTFLMGSPDSDDMARDNERPKHQVQVSGFRIARTPVTASLYAEIMDPDRQGTAGEQPATDVTWFDAIEFCNRLSHRHRYRPCYRRLGIGPLTFWRCNWKANGYRLPTEAEWEYACRAGTRTRYSFGEDPGRLDAFAWYGDNSSRVPQTVGTKRANPWGLFDIHGNIWEWCWDWYGAYQRDKVKDPHGPWRGRRRVLRGGSFGSSPEFLRSASRDAVEPVGWGWFFGFRCVRVASPSMEPLDP